jgi:hypothetical protein
MTKIYIPTINFNEVNKISIFVLTRPFFATYGWVNDVKNKEIWNLPQSICYVTSVEEADFVLLAHPINWYYKNKKNKELSIINDECKKLNKRIYTFINNDFGIAFQEYSNIIYYRIGGFKSQLSNNNIGFPVALSDHFQRLYNLENPILRKKSLKPIIGFCGHATNSPLKRVKEILKCVLENNKRFFKNPLRKDWEPLFASAYERWKLLQLLQQSSVLECCFILRENYRGGAKTKEIKEKTTLEYYDNLLQTDYVLCLRGAGNFSVRFYEALMMGKIPIFVNTDCLLPLEDEIDWKKQVVWIEWKDRKNIANIVADFHQKISEEEFIQLQLSNRQIWKEKLTTSYYLNKISNAV